MALEHIRNFVLVMPGLATAGQPSEPQLREVADHGFEIVVNLGLLDPRYCLPDEAGLVLALGLEYHHIPVDFQTPQLADLQRFFCVLDAIKGKEAFVHCAANMRVSSFVSLYGQAHLGWSLEKANALIARIWQPNEVWVQFIESARKNLEAKS
jgi:protein tyrosine phosphatase (PTP) superfamily phosphohydrolase (DUF442 family)